MKRRDPPSQYKPCPAHGRLWNWWGCLGRLWPWALSGCIATGSGAYVDNCSVIPQGAIPAPAGHYVGQFVCSQTEKAEKDDFVIYKHEWCNGGLTLGPYGAYHLNNIAHRLRNEPYPVLIQVEADPMLNTMRRRIIVQLLQHAGITDADPRVLVGFPEAEGLYGEEALRIYSRIIAGGGASGLGAGAFGGAGSPGFGGAAAGIPGGGAATFGGVFPGR